MRKIYAIMAYEDTHGGRLGDYDKAVVEAENVEEVLTIAKEMATEVILNNSTLEEKIKGQARQAVEEDEGLDYDETLSDFIQDSIRYRIWILDPEKAGLFTLSELTEFFWSTGDTFLTAYEAVEMRV